MVVINSRPPPKPMMDDIITRNEHMLIEPKAAVILASPFARYDQDISSQKSMLNAYLRTIVRVLWYRIHGTG